MRYFDNDLKEIFIYGYGEGEYDGAWDVTLYSYRQISNEENKQVKEEYAALQDSYRKAIEALKVSSGLGKNWPSGKKRDSKDQDEAWKKYSEGFALLRPLPQYYDFLKERFELKEFEHIDYLS